MSSSEVQSRRVGIIGTIELAQRLAAHPSNDPQAGTPPQPSHTHFAFSLLFLDAFSLLFLSLQGKLGLSSLVASILYIGEDPLKKVTIARWTIAC